MGDFKKGDILIGEKREFNEAFHPIVYIDGPSDAPLAVILTHGIQNKYPCNMKLSKIYDPNDNSDQYFVAHYIEKLSVWGEYHKIDEIIQEDLTLIEMSISGQRPITWSEYLQYKENGCPDHV